MLNFPAIGQESLEKVRKHFEWGDYDSLLVKVPEMLANDTSLGEAQTAELYKFLAVARYARGDSAGADDDYNKALQLNENVTLDSFYVDSLAFRYFADLKAKWIIKKDIKPEPPDTAGIPEVQKDTLSVSQLAPPEDTLQGLKKEEGADSDSLTLKSSEPRETAESESAIPKPGGRRGMVWLGAGSLATAAVLGGLSFGQYQKGEDNFAAFKKARDDHQMDVWREKKEEVEKNDRWMLIYGGGSLLSAATGVYLLIRGNKSKPKGRESSSKKSSWGIYSLGYSGLMIYYEYGF